MTKRQDGLQILTILRRYVVADVAA